MPTPLMSDEDLVRELPLPLAQLYRRAHNASAPLERHQATYYCWEAGLKLLASAALLEYAGRGGGDPAVTARLGNLARPSLGHWWEFVHQLVPHLAEPPGGPFAQVKEGLLGRTQSLPTSAALLAALRGALKQEVRRDKRWTVRELFDTLIQYRNVEVGHGSLGMRAEEFYGRMADALLAALPELFRRLDVLAGGRLVYVSEVSRDAGGSWVVELLELVGETARRAPALRLRQGGEGLPVPKRLYVRRAVTAAGEMPSLASLHPLVIYEERARAVFFLNAQRGGDEVEYLDYVDGEHLAREDLAADHRVLMAKVLRAPVDAERLRTLAAGARGEDAAAPGAVAAAPAVLDVALRAPPPTPSKGSRPAGVLPLDSEFYVARPTDDEFLAALRRQDSIIRVRGPRQVGKTSLLARGLQRARAAGARVVVTDFQKLNASDLASVESFFRALGEWVADELGIDVLPGQVWNPQRGPSRNFEQYVSREIMGRVPGPLVWAMDEVDRLYPCPFRSEVFGLFRSWHNDRDRKPEWKKLTLVIVYATEANLFDDDMNQSPFNVGTALALDDFTPEQVADLNRRYGSPLRSEEHLKHYYELVGGHPFPANLGLYEIVQRGMDLTAFEAQAQRDDGVFGDLLRRIVVLLARNDELCEVVRGVMQGKPCPSVEAFYRLRSAGVLAGDSPRTARLRCRLYRLFLERNLS
jgi:hypothetical protein